MSKNEPAKTTELVKPQGGTLAEFNYGEDAALGFEGQTNEDGMIPFLVILQGLSPQISKPSQKIAGAEVGMLMNSVSKQLYDGKTGVIIQPAATLHNYTEWKPRKDGGGLVGQYSIDDPFITKIKNEQEFGKYMNGKNNVIETYSLVALIHDNENLDEVAKANPQPVMLSFSSTKIKSYKTIMSRLRQLKGNIPLFAHRLRVTTFIDSNSQGDFGNFVINPLVNDNIRDSLIPPSYASLILAGKELNKAFLSGKTKANHESTNETDGGGDDTVPF